MTFTLNGIGTQTYGKLNRLERADHCDHCQTLGTLQSYDTTKYFVILFVPLIPLGKLRILDHCQRCNRWRQVNLKKWQHDKEAALRSALDGLKRNHQDADAVRTALATATQFQDQTLLLKLKSLVDTMTHDHETQILYASASIYFGNPQEAITPLKHAIAAHDTRETREHLAATLLEIGDSQQAEHYVDYVWKEPDPTHLPMCRAIAEAYQQSNDHAAAIDRINHIETLHPELAEDREFAAFRKRAEKFRSSNQVVPSKFSTRPQNSQVKQGGINFAAYVGPIIVALLIVGYISLAFVKGNARELHVINGTESAYIATIDGTNIELQPGQRKTITLSEGPVTVSAKGAGFRIPEQTVSIKTPFFSRPFSNPTFVVNPDQTAVIEHAEIIYAVRHDGLNETEPSFHTGKILHQYSGVHFPFEIPPEEITLDGGKPTSRFCTTVIDSESALYYISDPNDQLEFCKRQIQYGSNSQIYIATLASLFEIDEFIEFARPYLNRQPLNVEWHRMYQSRLEQEKPGHDLVAEYKALAEQSRENSELLYLLARVTPEPSEKTTILEAACALSDVGPYANYGMAYSLMSRAEFARARPYIQKAFDAIPDSSTFSSVYFDCLKANGDWKSAIEFAQKLNDIDDDSNSAYSRFGTLSATIPLLVAHGEKAKAASEIDNVIQDLQREEGDLTTSQISSLRSSLQLSYDYSVGNFEGVAKWSNENETPHFGLLLHRGELETVSEFLAEDEPGYSGHLLLFIAATDAGNKVLADKHLSLAIDLLRLGGNDHRLIADILESGEHPSTIPSGEILYPVPSSFQEASTIALALAKRVPERKLEYTSYAVKMNFDRTYPYWFIKNSAQPDWFGE